MALAIGYSPFLRFSARALLSCSRSCLELNHSFVTSGSSDVQVPAPPKRPASAFSQYHHDHFKSIHAQNPGMKISEIMKLNGQNFRSLPESEKQSYKDAAQFRLDAYKEDYAKFRASLTPEQLEAFTDGMKMKRDQALKRKIKLKKKKLDKPKMPTSGFGLFMMRNLKNETNAVQVLSSSLAPKWRSMSDAEKKPYVDQAKELQEQYQHALLEWERLMFEEGHHEVIRTSTLKTLLPKKERARSKKASKNKKSSKSSKKNKDDASDKNDPQSWMREE